MFEIIEIFGNRKNVTHTAQFCLNSQEILKYTEGTKYIEGTIKLRIVT